MGAADDPRQNADLLQPVRAANAEGRAPLAIVVDHPGNLVLLPWADLGLAPADRIRHIAWESGALAVPLRLSDLLHVPVVHSILSRLVIDCNRDLGASDLASTVPEHTEIAGSAALTHADRQWRVHSPRHDVAFSLETARGSTPHQWVGKAIPER